jgi:hypothetical protein
VVEVGLVCGEERFGKILVVKGRLLERVTRAFVPVSLVYHVLASLSGPERI